MPSNLYERKNEFRLYDVEGVLLSPNDYILINEPEGFRDFNITLERDPDKHGVFYEFGGEDELLGFDRVKLQGQAYSPYTFISALIGSKGIDAKIQFEFLNEGVSQYLGDLDFESLSQEDYKISTNARRVLLGDLFRTRIETPVDFSKTTSIDGDPITGLTPSEMFLHSKSISYVQNATSVRSSGFKSIDPNDTYYVQLDFRAEVSSFSGSLPIPDYQNNIESNFGNGLGTFLTNDFDQLLDHYDFKRNVSIKIDFKYDYNLVTAFPVLDSEVIYEGSFVEIDGTEIRIAPSQTFIVDNSSIFVPVIQFNKTATYNSSSGRIKFYDKWRFTGNDDFDVITDIDIRNNHQITIIAKTYEPGNESSCYNLFESTNHIIESITNKTNVLESDFLQNNASNIYQTNGYAIRDFDSSDSSVDVNVKTDFKSQFDKFLQPVFGLGYSIYDDSGDFKVLIERYPEFYQDVEIDYIDTVQDGTYFREYDKELIYNELKVGYKEFPKSTDENTSNNVDEFNTEHINLSPIESVKSKKDYISEAIASGYKIENQRREQFKDVPSDTVSDDDKIFVINGIDSDTYEDVECNVQGNINLVISRGSFLDIKAGDVITLFFAGNPFTDPLDVTEVELKGEEFRITFSNAGQPDQSGFSTFDVVRDSSRLRALRNDEFSSLDNVDDPDTVYNVGFNPKYMLKNHSLILNSGFNPKPSSSTIKSQDVKLNGEMECQFKAGEGNYNLNPNPPVKMNQDTTLATFNNYEKLFSGFLIKFTARISYQRLIVIRNAYLNQTNNLNFGLIRIQDPFGVDRSGFLMNLTYNPLSEQAEFILREKFTPEGGQFDYDLDFVIN